MDLRVVIVALLTVGAAALAGEALGQTPAAQPAQSSVAGPVLAAPSAGSPGNSTQPALAPAAAPPPNEAVTLLRMVRWGGAILWAIMALGFVALVMSVYFLLTVTPKREAPPTLAKRLLSQIRAGDFRAAYQLCEGRDEMLANVVRAGLRMSGHDRYVIQDAMESEGDRAATSLWQKIFYLNNIGVVAPLVGLLGTVWGMVLAFASIASDNAQVRSIAVASCVSKAMICTVGGLVVAIPSLSIYYYLRGRVVRIIAEVEAHASEVVELLSREKES